MRQSSPRGLKSALANKKKKMEKKALLIDRIIGAFFEKRSVVKLLKEATSYCGMDGGLGVTYKFNEQTYDGVIRGRMRENDNGKRICTLVVHLSHDGLHKEQHWPLPNELKNLEHLEKLCKDAGATKVNFRFNGPIDILLFREEEHIITLCFEHGLPSYKKDIYAIDATKMNAQKNGTRGVDCNY